MKFRLFLLFFGFIQFSFGQSTLPQDYFKSPLEVPLYLAGNFGELRSNHFHSGLDLKTQQRTGLHVNASAKGYVSRIKISLYGYGNVLYVQHPNGYTTVYGHLQEFAPKIRMYVRKRMYAQQKNTIELFPKKGELPVKQGELIALSGESGGAGGPHLHFEIRDDAQRPMNPLEFGMHIKDTRPPRIKGLYVYPEGRESHVNKSAKRQKLHLFKQKDGTYKTNTVNAFGKIGFGVSAVDYMDGSHNTDGLYIIESCLNGERSFTIKFNRFSFANSRYINRYIDYGYYKKNKRRVQKLFLESNNNIDMSVETTDKGFLHIKDSLSYKYEIILKDFSGNETLIRVPIQAQEIPENDIVHKKIDTTDYYGYSNKPNVFDLEYHDIYIPKGALYEDTFLDLKDHPNKVEVHRYTTPLHKNMTIGFDASKYTAADREKLYVARTYPWGTKYYSKTYKDGSRITTKTRTFGTYKLVMDTIPPTITPINFRAKKWISNAKYLKIKIKDDDSGISTYRGTINGKFIVLEYDYKTHTLQYDFRDKVSNQTENKLKLIVVDHVGNSSTFETTFFRKE